MTHTAEDVLSAAAVLREIIAPLVARIEALEQITKAIAQREDAGIWQPGVNYPKYAGVTHDGGYWVSQRQTSERPGEGNPSWRLVVHRGKQGRQGPPGVCRCAERERVAS